MVEHRLYDPHKLHRKKGVFYVSVLVPPQIRHAFAEPRLRRSTGTSDKRTAERIAVQKLTEIHRALDEAFETLDPFIEALRYLLEREGVDVNKWYTEGAVSIRVVGSRTEAARRLGVSNFIKDGKTYPYSETWSASTHRDVARMLTGLGHAVPDSALQFLEEQEKAPLQADSHPSSATPLETMRLYAAVPELLSNPEGAQLLENLSQPHQKVSIKSKAVTVPLFSTLVENYLASKKESSKDASQRKKSCERFLELIGDKPVTEYDKLHAIELARLMDEQAYSNAQIKKTVSHVRGLLKFAGTVRNEAGKVVLPNHPWHEIELSEYGTEKRHYKSFSQEELCAIFAQEIPDQEYLLLSTLITTGMRLDEAALMTWDRVTEYQGIDCFSLVGSTPGEVRVKNRGSMRYIPIPEVLRPILRNKKSTGRLFTYRMDRDGKAQAKASDAVMPWIRNVTMDDRKVAHSMRSTFKDLVRSLQVTKEINDFITGHAQGDVAGEYGEGPAMQVRLQILNAVKHPWLTH
ncbi:MAG: hypothetical protein KGN33_15420 [Paracoccaceae bacterium]|nr:hypothetical protein [Paracoccaceae bacterium]